ncbi:hypothetical protein GGX14DRAFT_526950 [Mycena pura]|uniref:Uncharacterized protein n=1 Tax=Mycena pura TaxID=153505 RepID=A0AAD6UVT9_9AGAR|nr:hypothetical protein GGX14DRAFT_526950 [Mycena pura]
MWACRISKDFIADSGYSEADLLAQTVSSIAGDTVIIDSWHRALRVMQAHVLLSLYYMEAGRFLEGKSNCAAATSLAFSTGLDQPELGYPSYTGSFPLEFLRLSLPEVAYDSRSTESLDAFRAVVILNNYWVAVAGVPSSIPSGAMINTTWTMSDSLSHHRSSMYTFPSQYPQVANLHSAEGFTNYDDSGASTLTTLLADASILLERTIVFTALCQNIDPRPGTDSPHPGEFWALDHRLETFRESLLPVCGAGSVHAAQLRLIIHTFVHAAILQLHSPHNAASLVSHAKCLSAASGVAACLGRARLAGWAHVDPVLGPLLAVFVESLIVQLPLSMGTPDILSTILSALQTLAPRSALIETCYIATQQRYAVAQMNMELEVLPQQ